jgi:hypothetical protein
MEVREASEEAVAEHLAEQEQKRQARGRARNAKEAAFAAKVANRMGNDIIRLGGMPVTAAIEKRVQDLLKVAPAPRPAAGRSLCPDPLNPKGANCDAEPPSPRAQGYGQPREGANTPLKTSLVAMAILEEYLGFAEDAEDTRLWKVVAPSLSLDWAVLPSPRPALSAQRPAPPAPPLLEPASPPPPLPLVLSGHAASITLY